MSPALVQSRIAAAVASAVEDRGQRAVGAVVGHAGSTLSRWGADLGAWSASALLALAADDAEVRDVMARALSDGEPPRRMGDAVRESCGAIAGMSLAAAHLATDLADGRIDAAEARARRPEIRALLNSLRQLDAALASTAGDAP